MWEWFVRIFVSIHGGIGADQSNIFRSGRGGAGGLGHYDRLSAVLVQIDSTGAAGVASVQAERRQIPAMAQ